jgi:hypothetical protein
VWRRLGRLLLGNDLGSVIDVGAQYCGDGHAGAPMGDLSDSLGGRSHAETTV